MMQKQRACQDGTYHDCYRLHQPVLQRRGTSAVLLGFRDQTLAGTWSLHQEAIPGAEPGTERDSSVWTQNNQPQPALYCPYGVSDDKLPFHLRELEIN